VAKKQKINLEKAKEMRKELKLKVLHHDYVTKRKPSKVQCLSCGEVLLSTSVHDFQHCNCPNYTFVDGGSEYYRYGGMDMHKILIFNPDGSSQIAGKLQNVKKQIE